MDKDSAEWHRADSEKRLAEIRRHASDFGTRTRPGSSGQQTSSGSAVSGYYGLPLLKPPQWKWEVPAYFFTGGAAGAAAVIAGVGELCRADHQLVRDARWVAALCGAVSPLLLISDLGRPSRFLGMLRVFKIRSPMSVGSWTLAVFSSAAAAALFTKDFTRKQNVALRLVRVSAQVVATLTGLPIATYTGVLLGATAIPVWSASVAELPVHFAASGLGAAVSLLELKGHDTDPALNRLGIGSAAVETALAIRWRTRRDLALEAMKAGRVGWLGRTGAFLSGPLPLALRLVARGSETPRSVRLRRFAAFSTVAGSLLTRFAWVHAGRASALNPALPLQLPKRASP
jgi:Polysulphide reductase, NrfD